MAGLFLFMGEGVEAVRIAVTTLFFSILAVAMLSLNQA